MIEVKNHITPAIYRRLCWFGVRYHNRKINRIVFVLCLLYLILGVFSTDISSLIQAIVTDIIVAALMLSIYIVSILYENIGLKPEVIQGAESLHICNISYYQ